MHQKRVVIVDRTGLFIVAFNVQRRQIAVFVAVTPPSDDLDDVAVDVRDLVVGSDRPLDGLNDLDGGSAADEARHVTLQIPEILFLVRATRKVQTKKVLNLKIGPDS